MKPTLSFKQYLDSKAKLYEALERDPVHQAIYEVHKYCRIVVGGLKEDKQYINLKPKQKILVKWRYAKLDETPDPVSISLPHLCESDHDESSFETFQSGERLMKWLRNNARELK